MQYTTLKELSVLSQITENNISKVTQILNSKFEKGLISEELCENSFKELDNLIEKAGVHKYFKREGSPGNYKYYYTEAEYREAKSKKSEGKSDKSNELVSEDLKNQIENLRSSPISNLNERLSKLHQEMTELEGKKAFYEDENFTKNIEQKISSISDIAKKQGLYISKISSINKNETNDNIRFSLNLKSTGKFKFISFKGYDSRGRGVNDKQLTGKAQKLQESFKSINGVDSASVNKFSLEDDSTNYHSSRRDVADNRVMLDITFNN